MADEGISQSLQNQREGRNKEKSLNQGLLNNRLAFRLFFSVF